jgi:hypothetical protein
MSENSWKDKIEKMKNEISIDTAAKDLEIHFDKYEWFYTTRVEGNSICVYMTHMDKDNMRLVPDVFYGYHVKCGFKGYLTCAEKYGKKPIGFGSLNELEDLD